MKKYGLIGYPLSHSFSPTYFLEKFRQEKILHTTYKVYPLSAISEIEMVIHELDGFNITIPYKEQILPYLDYISPEAKKINAVNTVKVTDGKLHGYNTDVFGFRQSLIPMIKGSHFDKALILGTGGAAKAVQYVLDDLNIKYLNVSRNKPYLTYDELTPDIIQENLLIINTTPLGMYPQVNTKPKIPYTHITRKHFLYDLVYNPNKTLFLDLGKRQGATILNGMEMLILQAEKSWAIWNQM